MEIKRDIWMTRNLCLWCQSLSLKQYFQCLTTAITSPTLMRKNVYTAILICKICFGVNILPLGSFFFFFTIPQGWHCYTAQSSWVRRAEDFHTRGVCFWQTKCWRFKLDLYCSVALRGYSLAMDVATDRSINRWNPPLSFKSKRTPYLQRDSLVSTVNLALGC